MLYTWLPKLRWHHFEFTEYFMKFIDCNECLRMVFNFKYLFNRIENGIIKIAQHSATQPNFRFVFIEKTRNYSINDPDC